MSQSTHPGGRQLVWFKRDLRVVDHVPLMEAALAGPVTCLYILEPALMAGPDMAGRHYGFLAESLRDLHRQLAGLGGRLHVVTGETVEVLDRLHHEHPIHGLWSHEETGNAWTYARDRAVSRWCRERGVPWHQAQQFGVVRALSDRDEWAGRWEAFMGSPQRISAARIEWADLGWPQQRLPDAEALGLPADPCPGRQRGGRALGLAVLEEFLEQRSGAYRGGISSPLSAPTACSRLSPYLALGCLGMREVVQATRTTLAGLEEGDRRRRGLAAFVSRLHWHCHFIQKLESEPEIEWRNMHRGYDGLREEDWSDERFTALREGRTGWPLVDAVVAMLRETGWINFRMRAMLVSVAAYPLWLHWPRVGHWLAGQFTDYEPGIHWSQMQMQSGTTGINTTRVYNPLKQARDHDPEGRFVRRWLPQLERVPDSWLFEPWRMPRSLQEQVGVHVGRDWPEPPLDLEIALREAKARMHAWRGRPEVRAGKAGVVHRHGSRKKMTGARLGSRRPAGQYSLDLSD
ncbi:MAG: FAD-binding domain-containing protein [Steroidobacteraceae bacterium]